MSERPWMPLYVADYLADTDGLSTGQHGLYLLMLMMCWKSRDGSIPGTDDELLRRLKSWAPIHGKTFNADAPVVLSRFFERDQNGNWVNTRVQKEREKALKVSRKQSENSSKRWAKTNENNGLPDAMAMPLHLHSQQPRKKEEIPSVSLAPQGVATDFPKDAFDRWISVYPRKKARAAAERAFARIAKSGKVTFAELMAGVQRLAASGRDPQYTPYPATWLNAGSWADEPDRETAQTSHHRPASRADTMLAVGLARIARQREAGRVSPGDDDGSDPGSPEEDGGRSGIDLFGQAAARRNNGDNVSAFVFARPQRGDDAGGRPALLGIRGGAGGRPDVGGGGSGPTLDLRADGECDLRPDAPAIATGG